MRKCATCGKWKSPALYRTVPGGQLSKSCLVCDPRVQGMNSMRRAAVPLTQDIPLNKPSKKGFEYFMTKGKRRILGE